jgi:hypothetical protein
VLVLVVVLVLTNLVTAGALVYVRLRPADPPPGDPAVEAALAAMVPVVGPAGSTRRFISIEILNPVELAGTRGRMLGIASTLAPGLTRRIVYDQTVKILRTQLAQQSVAADVHLHQLRPRPGVETSPEARLDPNEPLDLEAVNFVDEIDAPPTASE